MMEDKKVIKLPRPFLSGGLSLVEAILVRRSVREFEPTPLQLFHISQLLWAAQGITRTEGNLKSVPSAGGTFPLEVYLVVGESGLETVEAGVYHYDPEFNILTLHLSGDLRNDLAEASMGQDPIVAAPVSIVICAVNDRTLNRYNQRGERYVDMEVGHAGQNIYLQATALNLGTVAVGAFRDEQVRTLLQLEPNTKPLYIMPVGVAGII